MVPSEEVEETSKHGVRFHLIVSRKAIMMETGEIINEIVYESPRPPKISDKENWMKELVQKLLEVVKTPNKPNQKTKIHL